MAYTITYNQFNSEGKKEVRKVHFIVSNVLEAIQNFIDMKYDCDDDGNNYHVYHKLEDIISITKREN